MDLLLAEWDPSKYNVAVEGFIDNLSLCERHVRRHPEDRWRYADLAEAYLFSGEVHQAISTFQNALQIVPPAEQADYLRSILGPMKGYLLSGGVPDLMKSHVRQVLDSMPKFN